MRSPLLDTPGAVAAETPDADVAGHYGDPFAEQRALLAGEAMVDRSNREVVRISGPDRLSWLNNLSSQKLDDLKPGQATQTLLLDAQGRVEHHLTLVDDGEAVWAHVEPGTAAELAAFLNKMRFMLRVEVAEVTDDYAVVSVVRGRAAHPAGGGRPRRRRRAPPARPAGRAARRVKPRRALGLRGAADRGRTVPASGFETDHRTIPHEVGWIGSAVHLSKGCYRGQETVARVHNLGHPPRRLVFLHLDGSVDTLPKHGTPVVLDDGEVGFVGSAARHYELGPIALALVKRTVPVDATLTAGEVAATQEVIVPPDAGRNVQIDPALRRRIR